MRLISEKDNGVYNAVTAKKSPGWIQGLECVCT